MARSSLVVALALFLGICQTAVAQEPAPAQDPAPAQEPAPQDDQAQQPTFRTGINFVRVDVIVTDDDARPIADLTQADFEVLEDGVPQTIEQFRLVQVDGQPAPGERPPSPIRGPADEEVVLSREDVRVFVFFLDDYHVRRANAIQVRETLAQFVQQLGPADVVGIMYPLTPLTDLGFTNDHAATARALMRFEGRKFDYRPMNPIERQYERLPAEQVEQIRNQVSMSALRGLTTRLGGIREGRKSVIFVSEGFTAMLPPQLRTPDASLPPGLVNPAARNPQAGENDPRQQTALAFAQTDLYQRMREVYGEANRNNTSIYTVDPRGLAGSEFGIDENVGPRQDAQLLRLSQDTLRVLADETDGRAIVNRNDITPGLAQIVRDASFYYLIGYNSSEAPTDGQFHEIEVRVRRPGVDVRARSGYWAFTADDIVRATTPVPDTPRPIQQALASIAPSVLAGKYVQTWIGTARGEDGRTRVSVVWEPLPQPSGVRRDAPGRLSVLAADAQGDLVFRGGAPDRPSAAGGSAAPAAPRRLVFDASPGELELRLTVEGADGAGVLDSEIRTVTVPDLTSPEAAISTPRVFRARTAVEFRTLAADPDAVPSAMREFSRTERLLIRFDVYGNTTPAAALLNRDGDRMADLPVAPAGAGGTHQIDLGLNAVPAGEYLVEITATGTDGGATVLVPLRIGS